MYIAAVLTPESVEALKLSFEQNVPEKDRSGLVYDSVSGYLLPHHMTINMGKLDESLNSPEILGKKAVIFVQKFWVNQKIGVAAAEVSGNQGDGFVVKVANLSPHVTVALRIGCKPFFSNMMLDLHRETSLFFPLEIPLELDTFIMNQ